MSGADTPLGEEREAYRVTLSWAGGGRVAEVGESAFPYSSALQALDGVTGALTVEVVQLGTQAPSRPARLILNV